MALSTFILDIGLYDLHSFHVFHMVGTEGRILFQTMLCSQEQPEAAVSLSTKYT